ncbi:MAG: DUF4359 domain-containing protein [Thermosynechococcaceae cyanobacterium]
MAAITAAKSLRYIGATVMGAASIILVLTNPSEIAYREFATQQTLNLLLRDLCQTNQPSSKTLEKLWGNSCETLSVKGAAEVEQFVTHNTQRQNLILCSLYITELPLYSLKVIGVSNHFIVISFGASQ